MVKKKSKQCELSHKNAHEIGVFSTYDASSIAKQCRRVYNVRVSRVETCALSIG